MFEREMRKCFRLAKKGLGKVSPNPLVGCVILDRNGQEISTGYHHAYGENHAERDALLKLDKSQTQGGTLIVNLEPCNHYGKTPPCSELIIEYGIKRVVISNTDPNPKAAGGIKKLRDHGIEVVTGVLEAGGKLLNRVFFTNILENRIYTVTKTATTIDGKIATKTGDSKWITSERSRKFVKKLRAQYDAILTSSSTVIADNPQMNHRRKIILDRAGKLDFSQQIFNQGEILLLTSGAPKYKVPNNVKIITVPEVNKQLDLKLVFKELYTQGIKCVFIEAGSKLNGALLKANLIDEIIHFVAPKILNDNNGTSCFHGEDINLIAQTKNFQMIELHPLAPDYYARYISNP